MYSTRLARLHLKMPKTMFISYKSHSVRMERKNFSKNLEIWRKSVRLQKMWPLWTRKFSPGHTSKMFTSVVQNRLYQFVEKGEHIESNLQKRFWEKVPVCVEHVETLIHIMNKARLKQTNSVITLVDLKNAFGDVNNHLFVESFKLHHIPDKVSTINPR